MSDALIIRDNQALSIAFTPQAFVLKNEALELAALIGRVDNADQNEAAVKATVEIARVLKLAEEARVAAKEPVLKFGKTIDETAKTFVADLKTEQMRLCGLTGSFMQLEQAKARAAAKLEQDRLDALEREKAEAQAKATSHEQLEAIAETFNNRAVQEAPKIVAPPRAAQQTVKEDIACEVFDLALLAKAHWNLVRVEPKIADIKTLLRQGIAVAGVRSWKVTKTGVRIGNEQKFIDVG